MGRLICWEDTLDGKLVWWLGNFGPHKGEEGICIGLMDWEVHSFSPNVGVGSGIVQGRVDDKVRD